MAAASSTKDRLGTPSSQRGGHVDDGHVEPGHPVGIVGGLEPTRVQGRPRRCVVDVLDVGAPGGQELDATGIQIEAHHVDSRLRQPAGPAEARRTPGRRRRAWRGPPVGLTGRRLGRGLMPALALSWWSVLRLSRSRIRTPGRGGRWWRGPCRWPCGRARWVRGSPRWPEHWSGPRVNSRLPHRIGLPLARRPGAGRSRSVANWSGGRGDGDQLVDVGVLGGQDLFLGRAELLVELLARAGCRRCGWGCRAHLVARRAGSSARPGRGCAPARPSRA